MVWPTLWAIRVWSYLLFKTQWESCHLDLKAWEQQVARRRRIYTQNLKNFAQALNKKSQPQKCLRNLKQFSNIYLCRVLLQLLDGKTLTYNPPPTHTHGHTQLVTHTQKIRNNLHFPLSLGGATCYLGYLLCLTAAVTSRPAFPKPHRTHKQTRKLQTDSRLQQPSCFMLGMFQGDYRVWQSNTYRNKTLKGGSAGNLGCSIQADYIKIMVPHESQN